jgi:hypothetical protein
MALIMNKQKGTVLFRSMIPFFVICLLMMCSCRKAAEHEGITIRWRDDRAVALAIPEKYVQQILQDSFPFTVHLAGTPGSPAVLGNYSRQMRTVQFDPLIPFTAGMTYEVRLPGRTEQIHIPERNAASPPSVVEIYPTQDTVPENLLKFFIRFSKSMQEGHALKHVALVNGSDTLQDVFLDLRPELWNADRTLLTLWLDPGRIKRHLQPNEKLGAPLQKGRTYSLIIRSQWKDTGGTPLASDFEKHFIAMQRDSVSPDPQHWQLEIPSAGTLQPLRLRFHEPLDYSLLTDAIHILDDDKNIVAGTLAPEEEETVCRFTPAIAWKKENYTLECETRLEDLAGNNLNRPFDRDIKLQPARDAATVYVRKFLPR